MGASVASKSPRLTFRLLAPCGSGGLFDSGGSQLVRRRREERRGYRDEKRRQLFPPEQLTS